MELILIDSQDPDLLVSLTNYEQFQHFGKNAAS
jgi:hypothetical protein